MFPTSDIFLNRYSFAATSGAAMTFSQCDLVAPPVVGMQ